VKHDEIAELIRGLRPPRRRRRRAGHHRRAPRGLPEVPGPRCGTTRLVAALLGNSGGNAPDGLWDRIASTLEEAPPPMRLDLPRRPGRCPPPRPIAAAPAPGSSPRWWLPRRPLVIGALGVQVRAARDHRISSLQTAMESASTVRARDPRAHRPPRPQGHPGVRRRQGSRPLAVVLPNGTGYLLAHDMPALAKGRTYQLVGPDRRRADLARASWARTRTTWRPSRSPRASVCWPSRTRRAPGVVRLAEPSRPRPAASPEHPRAVSRAASRHGCVR